MQLIVTADDFGYSPSRDDCIIDCFKNGIVTGTSLLVNGVTACEAVEKAKLACLCVGLHLNISEGVPISNPKSIPSLVKALNGRYVFLGKEGFIEAEKNDLIRIHDVETELRAQIERFILLTGSIPPYVDGHQHVHVYPCLAETIAKVLCEYGITKTRLMLEDMDEVGWMNTNPRKPFRQVIYHNTLKSIPIYNRYGVYGGFGIGCSIGGNNMYVQRIINTCLRYPHDKDSITTIELMSHPGVLEHSPEKYGCGEGCDAFSQSSDRVAEYRILTSHNFRQFLSDKGITLCSYANVQFQKHYEGPRKKRILLLLSQKEGTGNTTTGTRIAAHFLSLGFCVQVIDTSDDFTEQNLQSILRNQLYNDHSDVIALFCIHALRAGLFVLHTNTPFILMMGGTDINMSAIDPAKQQSVKEVLLKASHIIAFTNDMKDKAITLLQGEKTPPISVISQSSESPISVNHEIREVLQIPKQHRLVLLPSGLRSVYDFSIDEEQVKDITYCLPVFAEYHQTHPEVVLVIMGPILDVEYASSVLSYLKKENIVCKTKNAVVYKDEHFHYDGVYYMSPIPHSHFLNALLDVDIVVNTSKSEGYAAVIIESWSAKKVVIARNNPGNATVTQNGEFGLLFDTPEEFIGLLDKTLNNNEFKKSIETKAHEYYLKMNLYEKERDELKRILDSIYT